LVFIIHANTNRLLLFMVNNSFW